MAMPLWIKQREYDKFIEYEPGKFAVKVYDKALIEINKPYSQLIEYVDNNPVYMGSAEPGSLTSEEKWQIRKLTYDSSSNVTSILWAGGSTAFTFAWDDRADPSIVYS